MFDRVAPVARNMLGTRTRVSVTSLLPWIMAFVDVALLEEGALGEGRLVHSVFLIPSPVSSTAIRMSLASAMITDGLPSPVDPRMKEVIRIDGMLVIAIDDHVERAIAGQLGELHAEHLAPHVGPCRSTRPRGCCRTIR